MSLAVKKKVLVSPLIALLICLVVCLMVFLVTYVVPTFANLYMAIFQFTYAFGPGLVGVIRDATGTYTAPLILCRARPRSSGAGLVTAKDLYFLLI